MTKGMSMIKGMLVALALFCCWGNVASAQITMRRVLMAMPDSMAPYLNHSMMGELVEFAERSGRGEVKNKLEGTTSLDVFSPDYASLSMSQVAKMEVLFLPRTLGDTILCVVNTYQGPEPESVVRFYDPSWKPLSDDGLLAPFDKEALVRKPDTMAMEEYERLSRMIDPCLIAASVNPQEKSLTFSLSKPLLSKDDKQALDAILLQKYVKWDGETFK